VVIVTDCIGGCLSIYQMTTTIPKINKENRVTVIRNKTSSNKACCKAKMSDPIFFLWHSESSSISTFLHAWFILLFGQWILVIKITLENRSSQILRRMHIAAYKISHQFYMMYPWIPITRVQNNEVFCIINIICKCIRISLLSWQHTYSILIHDGCHMWTRGYWPIRITYSRWYVWFFRVRHSQVLLYVIFFTEYRWYLCPLHLWKRLCVISQSWLQNWYKFINQHYSSLFNLSNSD
jgi:hypothetical protein